MQCFVKVTATQPKIMNGSSHARGNKTYQVLEALETLWCWIPSISYPIPPRADILYSAYYFIFAVEFWL